MSIRSHFPRHRARGQSVVEFALVLPLLVFLMSGIIDLGRIYTTMLSVESAAREAADFGSFGAQKWGAAALSATLPDGVTPDGTVQRMERRACTAASNLPDYVGPDGDCANPDFSYQLSTDRGVTWVDYDPGLGCDNATREPPCWVKVTLAYDFHLLIPLRIEAFGNRYGLPDMITFERSSVFPMTDLSLEP
jgi:TadE-like protein